MSYKLNRYEYQERDVQGRFFTVGYSIKEGVKPHGFPGERLVDSFTINVIPKEERD